MIDRNHTAILRVSISEILTALALPADTQYDLVWIDGNQLDGELCIRCSNRAFYCSHPFSGASVISYRRSFVDRCPGPIKEGE